MEPKNPNSYIICKKKLSIVLYSPVEACTKSVDDENPFPNNKFKGFNLSKNLSNKNILSSFEP